MPKWLRVMLAVVVVTIVAVSVTLIAGLTDAFGTGTQLQASIGPWSADGAKGDTFWDSTPFDIPGATVTAVHCHGKVQYELQLGATGPSHDNPCYADMGSYSPGSGDWGVYMYLPGSQAVYRISQGYAPWRYCIAGLTVGLQGPDLSTPC